MRKVLIILLCSLSVLCYGQGITLPATGAGYPNSNNLFNGMVQAKVGLKTGTDTAKARALWSMFPALVDTGFMVVQNGYFFYFDGLYWQTPGGGGGGGAVNSVNGQTGNVNLTTSNIPEGTNKYFTDTRVYADTPQILNYTKSLIAGMQPAGNYITGLSGDGSASGPGIAAVTLSTVNSNTGSWGSTTQVPVFVVNGKGLITGVTLVTVAPAWSSITGTAAFITLTSLSASGPLSYNNATGAFTIQQASSIQAGYISATDWNTFNNKQAALGFTPVSLPQLSDSLAWYIPKYDSGILYVSAYDFDTAIAAIWPAISAKQAQLNGTGFVKIAGTTISYDNTTYYPASNPNGYITSSFATANLVPYTGATGNVNLGGNSLTDAGGHPSVFPHQRWLANAEDNAVFAWTDSVPGFPYIAIGDPFHNANFTSLYIDDYKQRIILNSDSVIVASTSGTGTRMVIASPTGELGTQAIPSGTVTSVTAGSGLSGGTITTTGTISLPTTGTAGTYGDATHVPVFTTDAYGRITGVTNTAITAGGTGTVTSVSVVTANGVSGTVATSTSTPAITLTLGAITPTSVNGLTITSSTGTLSITNLKTVSVTNTLTFSGTDGSTLNIGTGGTLGTNAYTSTAYAPLASPTFTGVPAAPTATGGTNTTQLATTAFVQAALPTSLPPNGSAGGVLSGTYPNPGLASSVALPGSPTVSGTASTATGGIATIDGTQTLTNKSIAYTEVTGISGTAPIGYTSGAITFNSAYAGTFTNWTWNGVAITGTYIVSSVALAGSPTTTTQSALDNSTKVATTAYADAAITALKTATATFTNKRWQARTGSTTSSGTPTINTDNFDIYKLTAQAANITSMTTNLSGTPNDGDLLLIEITATGSFTLAWGTSFVSGSVALPTAITTTTLKILVQYDVISSYGANKWTCVNYW